MTIGKKIYFLRNLRGMTQKYLDVQIGYPEKLIIFEKVFKSIEGRHSRHTCKHRRSVQSGIDLS